MWKYTKVDEEYNSHRSLRYWLSAVMYRPLKMKSIQRLRQLLWMLRPKLNPLGRKDRADSATEMQSFARGCLYHMIHETHWSSSHRSHH